MWSFNIVVGSPIFDHLAGMAVAGEQVFVQAFVTQSSIEAFDEAVLHRIARLDVMPFDTTVLLPLQDGI